MAMQSRSKSANCLIRMVSKLAGSCEFVKCFYHTYAYCILYRGWFHDTFVGIKSLCNVYDYLKRCASLFNYYIITSST